MANSGTWGGNRPRRGSRFGSFVILAPGTVDPWPDPLAAHTLAARRSAARSGADGMLQSQPERNDDHDPDGKENAPKGAFDRSGVLGKLQVASCCAA